MKTDNSSRYSSTRFTALTDTESTTTRRNYLLCLIIGIAFLCLSVIYFSYKIFINPSYFNSANSETSANETTFAKDRSKYSYLKLYNPKPLLEGFLRKTSKDHRELTCGEFQPQLEAIPAKFIPEILEKTFENTQDYVNLDLLLHYQNIINMNQAPVLKTIFNEYQLKLSLVKTSKDFLNFFTTVLKSNKFKFYANNLNESSLELKHFESFFALTQELNHWYNYLYLLRVFLSRYEVQKFKYYLVNCTKENFEKYTKVTQKQFSLFEYPFSITDKKLQEINKVIEEWAKPVQIAFKNSSIVFYGKVLILSALNQEIRGLNISSVMSVYFFASHSIYLDDDMNLFGVNLAIISPNWVFTKKVKISLNGRDGRNASEVAQPGRPGNPGENAGDFLGVGNPEEKFLIISANGGKGGNGQNGAKGHDGANNTRPDPPVDKPNCMARGKSFKNKFGQTITHYKIYSESGCGGSGTDGGVGGLGGAGGVVTFISKNSMKVRTGFNGAAGSPGKGGPGGIGGRDGCFYEALDIDDEILHRVTRVKCPTENVLPSGEFGKDGYNTRDQILPPVKENLNKQESILQFIEFSGEYFNSDAIMLLKELKLLNTKNTSDIMSEYNILEVLDKTEFYDAFRENIDELMKQPLASHTLAYLKSIVLGRMTILKENINFLFIDLKNYLNIVKEDLKNTNEYTRHLQSSIYLKRKVEVKKEQIKQNLQQIKFRLNSSVDRNCVMVATINVLQSLLTSGESHSKDTFSLCWSYFKQDNGTERNNLPKDEEKNVLKILKNLTTGEDVGGHLKRLKDNLSVTKNADMFSEKEKNLLEALTHELEHFLAISDFLDWERLENLFIQSLHDLSLNTTSETEFGEIDILRRKLVDTIIGVEYKLAMDALRQTLFPFDSINTNLKLSKNNPLDLVLKEITRLEEDTNRGTASFCRNQLKAVFDKNSAVGEFYYWPNLKLGNKLRILFSGAEINLNSNLINLHVFDKSFIQFTRLKLEFECDQNGCQEELDEVLSNFKIEITHSGYSYYNWKGDTRIVVSEKVSLEYSFRLRNHTEPEIYNALYKKCQDGEIKLSPFTTWSVRLLPINDKADYEKLLPFAEVVNLRLTGSGTYTSE